MEMELSIHRSKIDYSRFIRITKTIRSHYRKHQHLWINKHLEKLALNDTISLKFKYGFVSEVEFRKLPRDNPFLDTNQLQFLNRISISGHSHLQELPSWISSLSGPVFSCLKTLNLYNNRLEEIPDSIGNLKQLRTLNLGSNNLTYIPTSIIKMKKLKSLVLSKNNLREIPECVRSLVNLENLYGFQSSISEIPNWIGELSALKKIYLYDTYITQLSESISRLKELKELVVPVAAINHLPDSLETLYNEKRIRFQ